MTTKNIYQKIQSARIELQNLSLKKTGKNSYSNYTYYELSDFLPAINILMDKHGIFSEFSIQRMTDVEIAVLRLYNTDNPAEIAAFTLPTAEVEIGKKKDGTGGADPIQNLGGKTTYMRRYLHMIAFEMVESDTVEQIKRELTDEVSDDDLAQIKTAPDITSLQKTCATLKTKYNAKLIIPHYNLRKVELEQQEQQ
jgi:hypothetical protein